MKQKKIAKRTHKLELEQFDEDALKVIETLKAAGHTSYLVGGCVRDLLLGHKPKDFDISTSAKPEEIKKIFRNCILIGKRFRLAHLRFGKKVLEVSTFRKGDNDKGELILQDNVWGSPEEDVIRRDFTINALFYDPESESIIDIVDGYKDIQNKYLQTIGDPHIRFKQDPVRMIRALKFQARFDLQFDPATLQALEENRTQILFSSQARIFEELLKMLESGSSRNFFHLMHKYGLIEILLPRLSQSISKDKNYEIFSLLDQADVCTRSSDHPLSRYVLLSLLVFPELETILAEEYKKEEKNLHLGHVQKEASHLIDLTFRPFFHLPKRIKAKMVSILTTQFRLTPLEKVEKRRPRIPKTPDFSLGLDFLEVRSMLEPGYKLILEEWKEAYKAKPQHVKEYASPYPRRRRRRPRYKEQEQSE